MKLAAIAVIAGLVSAGALASCGNTIHSASVPAAPLVITTSTASAGGSVLTPPRTSSAGAFSVDTTASTPTASPVMARSSTEPAVVGPEDLRNLSFISNGEVIRLRDGESHTYRSETRRSKTRDRSFVLQAIAAQGDLNSDGDDDLVAHIIELTEGTGVFHWIVPVINDAGTPRALQPVMVGDRVVIDEMSIDEGLIEVALFDRAFDEPFTVITERKRLAIEPSWFGSQVRVLDVTPIFDLPLPALEQPDEIEIVFEPGATSASLAGTIGFRQRQNYVVKAIVGQQLVVDLEAPPGVWLDIGIDQHVVVAAAERSQRVDAELPTSGPWNISVVSAHSAPADYRLSIDVSRLGPASDPELSEAVQSPPIDGNEGVIYLSFDDGPHPVYTPQILEVLEGFNAHATFFVVGSQVEKYPELTNQIVAAGHTLANHTWNHEDLAVLPQSLFDETVGRTQSILGTHATACLRPPYASFNESTKEWAADHGLDLVIWTVDTGDWRRPGVWAIVNEIILGAQDGATILMHDGGGDRSQTVQALEIALPHLGSRFRFEPLCHPLTTPSEEPEK